MLSVLALAGLLASYAILLGTAGRASAQAPEPPPERVEALARIGVAEAGWDVSTGDHAAIAHLLLRRAERLGIRPRAMAHAYSGRHFDRTRTDRRRWIVGLTLTAAREGSSAPRGWPAQLAWSRYRPRWTRMVEHVRLVLRGRVADPCRGQADHWGSRSLDRAPVGWVRLDCGPTRNVFWRVPRRGEAS